MRIGILTFHAADNYGAVLQAYALVEWLRQNRMDPEIIDYRSRVFDKYKVFRTKLYRRAPYTFFVDVLKCAQKTKRNRNFDSFRKAYLPVSTEKYFSEKNLERAAENYDCFICGSDQIWNPELTQGVDPVYFLSFVQDSKKKIAFSPSVALKKLTEFQIAAMVQHMVSFSSLSIREQEAIDILQPYCEKTITRTCDPVFLLERDSYQNTVSNKYEGKRFIFLYVVGTAARFRNVIAYAERKAKERGLDLYYLIDGDKTFFHIRGKNVFGCKPTEFLSLVKNAEYVISNSFHATAFSIIFEKQFVTFLKDGTGSRMVNLLREFALDDRVFNEKTKEDVMEQLIDYTGFDTKLRDFRQSSVDYLFKALGKKCTVEAENEIAETDGEKRAAARKELMDFVAWRRKCFLARHRDANVVANSRSGGVFTALSDVVLQRGGVVYGCRMEGTGIAIHDRAVSKEERDRFRGSKYIQSEMRDCYRQVKNDLKEGRTVLFSGTGCQIAGLYGFLRGEDLSKLYTVDIICHGVPSQMLWNEYLKWIEKKQKDTVTDVNFRNKRYGWKSHLETVRIGDRIYVSSVFRVLFLKNAFLRPACYECPFSSLRRQSDITIGDAWGIEKRHSQLNDDKGCSLLLLNNKKGKELLDACQKNLDLESAELDNYLQPNLYQPSARPSNRQRYWDCLNKLGFDALAKQYGKPGPLRRFKDQKLVVTGKLRKN